MLRDVCPPPPARGLSSWALDGDWPSLSLSACFKETQPTRVLPVSPWGPPTASSFFSLLSDHEGPPHLLMCAESYYHFQKNPST